MARGSCETLCVDLPRIYSDVVRYAEDIVEKVRNLVQEQLADTDIAASSIWKRRSSTGKPFTISMIKWIRYKHNICQRPTDKMTVKGIAKNCKSARM